MNSIVLSRLKTAAALWPDISQSPLPADRWLFHVFKTRLKNAGSNDRRLITETLYGLFRHRSFLEAWCEFQKQNQSVLFKILCAAAVEGLLDEKQFFEMLEAAKLPVSEGAAFYAALISRKLPVACDSKNFSEKLSVQYSFPEWLIQRWVLIFGENELREILASLQQRPAFVIRTNTLKISRHDLMGQLKLKGYDVNESGESATAIRFEKWPHLLNDNLYRSGYLEVQDAGSQRICEIINPAPGESVLDFCAGGGGKSLALAALMKNRGKLLASDVRDWKFRELLLRARRSGVTLIRCMKMRTLLETPDFLKKFDKVIVDAPCSGSGTWRRNPDAKWRLNLDILTQHAVKQLDILKQAADYVRPGGRLYYVTCSIDPVENEEVMTAFLKYNAAWKSVPAGGDGKVWLKLQPHRNQTDGFFLGIAEKL